MKKYDLILRIDRVLPAAPTSVQDVQDSYTVQVPEQLLPPPWSRAPQRSPRRRRDPLTQETIVDAALAVLDADGLDLLSMRHIARTLEHDRRRAVLARRLQGRAARPDLRSRDRRAAGARPRPGALAGADQGRRAHDARDDPRPPRHRPPLDRPHPARPRTPALRRPRPRHPARGRAARRAGADRAATPDLDRPRLHDRRDRRGRRAACRCARRRRGRDDPRLPRLVAGRPVPEPRRDRRAHAGRNPDENFELLLDLFVDGLASPRRRR